MIIDLLGGSYQHRFKDWNSQRTVNWYPKITNQQEKNKTQMALVPRPGLSQLVDLSGNSIRGLFTARTLTQERLFAVRLQAKGPLRFPTILSDEKMK